MESTLRQVFDEIYQTDLVYHKDCWQLCGDAHCCSFSRHKARFRLMARGSFQELLLLPGEYEYLRDNGWLAQFGDYDHKVIHYHLENYQMKIEMIVSRRPNCACDHNIRPTVCRLYPLLPVYDTDGIYTGCELLAIYDELEKIDQLRPICQITALTFNELNKFLTIASAIARHPLTLYYVMAYRILKAQVVSGIRASVAGNSKSAFQYFEAGYIRNRLIDHELLLQELNGLAGYFARKYGDRFSLQTLRDPQI